MNKVVLVGRLTRDPEIRYANNEKNTCIARFSLAINRKFKTNGQYEADFPNCVAMGRAAEFLEKYFRKGDMIALDGRIQTGSYTNKDGNKVYTTDVIAENVEFAQGKSDGDCSNNNKQPSDEFVNVADGIDSELPFA